MKSFTTEFFPPGKNGSCHCITYNAQYAYLEYFGSIPVFPNSCEINYTLDSRWIQMIELLIWGEKIDTMKGSSGLSQITKIINTGIYDQVIFIGAKQDERVSKLLKHSNISFFPEYHDVDCWVEKITNTFEKRSRRILCLLFTGAPKQDLISVRLHELNVGPAVLHTVGLGGSYQVWTNKVRPCPRTVTYIGLEGLWRLINDPSKEKFYRAFKSFRGLYYYIKYLRC